MANPRLSLTAKQRETAVGVDLLALCQRVTADGTVTPDEAKELSRWLDESGTVEMPSIGYLRGTSSVSSQTEGSRKTNFVNYIWQLNA